MLFRSKMFVPPAAVCVDNGAMIAWQGTLQWLAGMETRLEDSTVMQRFRTDAVEASWL